MKNVYAIIPARGGSKGILRKNLQHVAGKPLVVHAIEQALASKYINHVIVSTEDKEIADVAMSCNVEIVNRTEEFIHDNSVQEVDRLLIYTVKQLEKKGHEIDLVVLLYPTAPLRRVETIDEAINKIETDNCDSVLSLYEDTTYLWAKDGDSVKPINYDPKTRGPRQKEYWNQYGENKAVYVMRRDLLVNTGCRLGGKIGYVEMSKLESIDVDKPEDLELCNTIMQLDLTRKISE